MRSPRLSADGYTDPYIAGVALGLVLLAAFVVMGRGLGASGAFARSAASLATAVDAHAASKNGYFASYIAEGVPWHDWLIVELVGVCVGGAASAIVAKRFAFRIERGPHIANGPRLALAALGGVTMGCGAVLARGCTSGQALTGGALLSVGSWCFMCGAFAGGYALAPLLARVWR